MVRERVIEQFYKIINDEEFESGYIELNIWGKMLMKQQQLLINNIKKIHSRQERIRLFLDIDLNSENMLMQTDKFMWEELYRDFFAGELDKNLKIQLALKFFLVIFSRDVKFSDEFVFEIVGILYQELKKSELSFDDWRQIEYLLPEVEYFYLWDKCLRVRKAVEQKGYVVNWAEYET